MTKSMVIKQDKDLSLKNPSNEERKSFRSIKTMDPETPNINNLIIPSDTEETKEDHLAKKLFGMEEKPKKPRINVNKDV